jgi:hypothetical protein
MKTMRAQRNQPMVSVEMKNGSAPLRNSDPALAHVPFDFVVGEMKLDAGPYAVELSGNAQMLKMRRADCDSPSVLVSFFGKDRSIEGELVFFRRAGRYFLALACAQIQ